jgi:hypothetical protein
LALNNPHWSKKWSFQVKTSLKHGIFALYWLHWLEMPFFGPGSAHWSQKGPIYTETSLFDVFLFHYKKYFAMKNPFFAKESPCWSQDCY